MLLLRPPSSSRVAAGAGLRAVPGRGPRAREGAFLPALPSSGVFYLEAGRLRGCRCLGGGVWRPLAAPGRKTTVRQMPLRRPGRAPQACGTVLRRRAARIGPDFFHIGEVFFNCLSGQEKFFRDPLPSPAGWVEKNATFHILVEKQQAPAAVHSGNMWE